MEEPALSDVLVAADFHDVEDEEFEEAVARVIQARRLRDVDMFLRRASDSTTLFHILAGMTGCSRLVSEMLDGGLPAHIPNKIGWTPLLEAARQGQAKACKLLLDRGATVKQAATITAADDGDDKEMEVTPLKAAIASKDVHTVGVILAEWRKLMHQEGAEPGWDLLLFFKLVKYTPGAVGDFLDLFATKIDDLGDSLSAYDFRYLIDVYGVPWIDFDQTPLAIVLRSPRARTILAHPLMRYIVATKMFSFARRQLAHELGIYALFMVSYILPAMFASREWNRFKSASDIFAAICRAIALACCLVLVFKIELKEWLADMKIHAPSYKHCGHWHYYASIWNWIDGTLYITTVVSITLDFAAHFPTTSACLEAVTITLLWIDSTQYLTLFPRVSLMLATVARMFVDLWRFFALYALFLLGFTGIFHALLSESARYKDFITSLYTVVHMLFGQIDFAEFDLSAKTSNWKRTIAHVLVVAYLCFTVTMLLNLLIAMMNTSYADVDRAASEEVLWQQAQAVARKEKVMDADERYEVIVQILEMHIHGYQPRRVLRSRKGKYSASYNLDKTGIVHQLKAATAKELAKRKEAGLNAKADKNQGNRHSAAARVGAATNSATTSMEPTGGEAADAKSLPPTPSGKAAASADTKQRGSQHAALVDPVTDTCYVSFDPDSDQQGGQQRDDDDDDDDEEDDSWIFEDVEALLSCDAKDAGKFYNGMEWVCTHAALEDGIQFMDDKYPLQTKSAI